ncbi:MAG: RNA polymerase sigma-54 factor [Planctomycetaceae bacterium]|nr:RNA polymerase sigma-54 factor [Planctomycetaceae bacterium]
MQLNFSQQMKMSQQMKLAPRMIQSMEILQLPILALEERIEQELSDNVVLERGREEDSNADAEAQVESPGGTEPTAVEQKEIVVDSDHNNEADFERLLEASQDWPEDNVISASRPSANRVAELGDRKHDAIANMTAPSQSLHEYLLEQFHFFNVTPEIRTFGEYLIQNFDEDGRLQSTLPEVVQVYGSQISHEEAQETLGLIQKLDPPGVGARDLKECLLLQLRDETPYRDVLLTLISSHLDDLSQNRLPVIQRKTGYGIDTIKNALEELRHLNPHPGRGFRSAPAQHVTADLLLERDEKGAWTVKLEDEYTPSLRISRRYREMLANGADQQTRDYIRKKIESAKWLIESIEQRQSTLRRVAQTIVDFQTEFLDKGPEAIVPLKMQQIADVVGVHVTTVSRAVDDKWIQTPRGLFPLKRFFGGGTKTAEGEDVAWGIIRMKLREIVDGEDKSRPLSDDALVEELGKAGYTLARRTVTKYRKAMDIPSSRQRREY